MHDELSGAELRPLLDAVVGENAALGELGVIVANPGSADQEVHTDTPAPINELGPGRSVPGTLLSVFVPLPDAASSTRCRDAR